MDRRHWSRLGAGVLAGLLLTLPFAVLELSHKTAGAASLANFPFPLYAVMWALAMIAVTAVAPFAGALRGRTGIMGHPIPLVLRLAIAAGATALWILLVQDQMPCVMGVPNCD